jgi:hypothetical protein
MGGFKMARSGLERDVTVIGAEVIQPVDIQSRYSQTIQLLNAVSNVANGWSNSAFIDTDGFDVIAITYMNDAATTSRALLQWSNDGVNIHGEDAVTLPTTTGTKLVGDTRTRARYVRLGIWNGDTTLAHTMSAWAYLKA